MHAVRPADPPPPQAPRHQRGGGRDRARAARPARPWPASSFSAADDIVLEPLEEPAAAATQARRVPHHTSTPRIHALAARRRLDHPASQPGAGVTSPAPAASATGRASLLNAPLQSQICRRVPSFELRKDSQGSGPTVMHGLTVRQRERELVKVPCTTAAQLESMDVPLLTISRRLPWTRIVCRASLSIARTSGRCRTRLNLAPFAVLTPLSSATSAGSPRSSARSAGPVLLARPLQAQICSLTPLDRLTFRTSRRLSDPSSVSSQRRPGPTLGSWRWLNSGFAAVKDGASSVDSSAIEVGEALAEGRDLTPVDRPLLSGVPVHESSSTRSCRRSPSPYRPGACRVRRLYRAGPAVPVPGAPGTGEDSAAAPRPSVALTTNVPARPGDRRILRMISPLAETDSPVAGPERSTPGGR